MCGKFMATQPVVTIEKWFTDGWQLYRKNRFTFFFASLLAALICIPPLFIFFAPPLYAGLYYMALKSACGENPRIRDIFKGFRRYWGAFFFWLIFLIVPLILFGTAIGILWVPLVWATLMLAFPLLIDEQQSAGFAFRTALKIVCAFTRKDWWPSLKNWGRFWLYGLALTFVAAIGIVGFGIGILITIPLAVCVQVVAYRDIFKPAEAFQSETTVPWGEYPFKLNAKYVGPISQLRDLRDRIFAQIAGTDESVKNLLESSIEHIDTVFGKAANLISRLQQIDDYLQTTGVQKLRAEKEGIMRSLAESPNVRVYSQYEEAFSTLEERIENHERVEELAAQISAQLTTIRVSLDNTHAKIIRIKTTGISNARFESDDVSKELRNLQIEMDALLSSLAETAETA